MENSAILTADILDIIFEGRNKEYGAYDLRKSYKKRMLISISVMLSLILLMFLGYAMAGNNDKKLADMRIIDTHLAPPPEKAPPPLPPPPVKPPPPQVQTAKFPPPRIVKDEEVKPEDKPPVNDDLENQKIGLVNQKGIVDENVTAPPDLGTDKGIIELPKKPNPDSLFLSVQIESEYPGGRPKWELFLNRNLQYPQEASDNEIQGTVVVQFIVDAEGNVSSVEAISGPAELRESAVRVIKKSGRWIPAVQNGTHVKSYKRQPILYRINN